MKSCGACARCVVACPTGALRGDYTIDASRCISDLTQRTDGVPRALRPLVGTWVWGCDVCQDVCPPTRNAGLGGDAAFAPAGDAAAPDLVALLQLRSAEFKRRFRGTAMGWRGAAILRRNAAVALGNAPRPLDRPGPGAGRAGGRASRRARPRRLGARTDRLAGRARRLAGGGGERTSPRGGRGDRRGACVDWKPSGRVRRWEAGGTLNG